MKLKAEDIAFLIFTGAALAVILWVLHGSPTFENALVSVGVFILSSEFMLWKKYFQMDKNAAVSFTRFKIDLDTIKKGQEELQESFRSMESRLLRGKK